MSLDVALQVTAELGGGGKEGQADSHQLPASRQAPGAAVARRLPHQLHVELVPQTRDVPALGDDEEGAVAPVQTRRPVPHVGLHQFEHFARLLPDQAVAGDQHGLLDGAAVPRQHVGDGDTAPEEALRVQVEVFAGPVLHARAGGRGLPQRGVGELVGGAPRTLSGSVLSFSAVVGSGAVGAQRRRPPVRHAFLPALQLSLELQSAHL